MSLLKSIIMAVMDGGAYTPPATQLIDFTDAIIACDGNSLTYGSGAPSQSYPIQLQAMAPFNTNGAVVYNLGIPGQTTEQMAEDADVEVDGLIDRTKYNVLIATEDLNEVAINVGTAAQHYQKTIDYYNARIAAGWNEVFVFTTFATNHENPSTVLGNGDTIAEYYQKVLDINALKLTGDDIPVNRVIRLDLVPELMDEYDEVYFSTDRTHLTAAGYTKFAEAVYDFITAALIPVDVTAPTVVQASVRESNQVTLSFNQTVTGTAAGFTFKKGATTIVPTGVTGLAEWIFTFATTFTSTDVVQVSHTATDVVDANNNALASFGLTTCDNLIPATADVVTYNETLPNGTTEAAHNGLIKNGGTDGVYQDFETTVQTFSFGDTLRFRSSNDASDLKMITFASSPSSPDETTGKGWQWQGNGGIKQISGGVTASTPITPCYNRAQWYKMEHLGGEIWLYKSYDGVTFYYCDKLQQGGGFPSNLTAIFGIATDGAKFEDIQKL